MLGSLLFDGIQTGRCGEQRMPQTTLSSLEWSERAAMEMKADAGLQNGASMVLLVKVSNL